MRAKTHCDGAEAPQPGYFRHPLPPDAAEHYRDCGYLVVENAFDLREVAELNAETTRICRGERGEIRGVQPAERGETDDAVLQRHLCIHFPHKISGPMREQLRHPSLVQTLVQIIGPNVKCMQSMLFIKSAGKPGQAWHQDEDFIPTRDRSLTGAWLALDDATTENGCLWVLPGSHRPGVIWPNRDHEDRRFDCTHESYGYPFRDEDALPVEVKAGSVVFFNGYLLHRSLPNTKESGYRRALVNHYMSAESLLPWHPPLEGQGMAQADFRDIELVAGEDPYAYKGFENRNTPHVRPDGKGGCGNQELNEEERDRSRASSG